MLSTRLAGLIVLLVVLAGGGLGYAAYRSHRQDQTETRVAMLTGGDPRAGPAAAVRYGCGGCHTIPGVAGAHGRVGPPLTGLGARIYVAGRLANTPSNLILWLRNPRGVDPQTAMPNMGVTDKDARDIAAYLYTLG